MLKDGMDKEKLRELKLKALELAKEKLKREIAGRLRLKTEGMTKNDINSRISEELNDNNNKGNNVILASRNQDICWGMDIDAIEEVKSLQK
uniref:Uncharacterized protein n=1 Tax=Manihot esculenta TaxID=3983 RepID=A0A2C9V7B0_MANES